MKILDNILLKVVSDLVKNIGEAFEKNFTSKDERLKARNDLMAQAGSILDVLQARRTQTLQAEMNGNWLQRSWRPIIMLMFGSIVLFAYFIQPVFFPGTDQVALTLNENFWDLLKLGLGGYIVGRSGEKIATAVTENLNVSTKTKRQR